MTFEALFYAILASNAITAGVFTIKLSSVLGTLRPQNKHNPVVNKKDLPTVSVCIPARNERHALALCLESVLASDYEKLEIIVFDDSSDDNTSTLIRSFAHAGVRFVPGVDLPEGWLGKNHALHVLTNEATGDFVLFMDVDVRIKTTTITSLMSDVVDKKKSMASVIPSRYDTLRASVLLSPLRYFWQLVFSGSKRPPVAGAFWLTDRNVLLGMEGLGRYKGSVQAESHIAKSLGDSYQPYVGMFGVSFEKKWSSQCETSRRLLYPLLRGAKLPFALLGLLLLNAPIVGALSSFIFGVGALQSVSVTALLMSMGMYALYTQAVWRRGWWLGALLWPFIVLQEFCLLVWSIASYLRHTVTWKGRSIHAPVLAAKRIKIDR